MRDRCKTFYGNSEYKMKELKQYKNFVKREFRITESKLFYNISKFGNGNEIDIPYENLNGEKVNYESGNYIFLAIAILSYLIAIAIQISLYRGVDGEKFAGLFWAGIGTVFLIIHFISRESFWKIRLTNDNYIYIHKNIPSNSATDQFLSDLMKCRNEFLKENYAIIDENLSYEGQLNNFKWLKSINAISKEEFDQKYDELKKCVKPDKQNIGFGK